MLGSESKNTKSCLDGDLGIRELSWYRGEWSSSSSGICCPFADFDNCSSSVEAEDSWCAVRTCLLCLSSLSPLSAFLFFKGSRDSDIEAKLEFLEAEQSALVRVWIDAFHLLSAGAKPNICADVCGPAALTVKMPSER